MGGGIIDTHSVSHTEDQGMQMNRVKKMLLVFLCIFLAVLLAAAGGFFYLREKGERELKEQLVSGSGDNSDESYVTYNGKRYKYNDNIINILCLGVDKELPIEEKRSSGSEGLSDAVLLVSINLEDKSVRILGIPRDTIVPVKILDTSGNLVGSENGQITLQYAYGQTAQQSCELMCDSVSNLLYQLPIHRYCSLNLLAVPVLNDAVGGVDVKVLEDIDGDHCKLTAGETVHLEGYAALDYIQERDTHVSRTSMGRLERQKQYMRNYFHQAKESVRDNPSLPVEVFQELEGNMCTNITVEDLTYLIPELLDCTLEEDNPEIQGEVTQPGKNEEFHVDQEALKELVIGYFYEEAEGEE